MIKVLETQSKVEETRMLNIKKGRSIKKSRLFIE